MPHADRLVIVLDDTNTREYKGITYDLDGGVVRIRTADGDEIVWPDHDIDDDQAEVHHSLLAVIDDAYEYHLTITIDPDQPPTPPIGFNADSTSSAIDRARQILADHAGPDDRYGELWARTGHRRIAHLDTIHLAQEGPA
ncbi:hypothetical protein [Polymorphospora sp. NPDC050346]|uniref:hypothetical protein n=1 Tax=Polymorphospora sp. NPDC050346 TaxID=3155780 RepID=UPI0033CAFE4A